MEKNTGTIAYAQAVPEKGKFIPEKRCDGWRGGASGSWGMEFF
jgi:hypothetical protein